MLFFCLFIGGAILGNLLTSVVTISKSDYPNGKFAFLGDDVIKLNNTATVVPKTFSIQRTGGLLGQQTVSLDLSQCTVKPV